MPRYFLHVDTGEFIPDASGTELPDLSAARREAVRCRRDDRRRAAFVWEHMTPWNMHVTDSDDRLLFTLQFGAKIPSEEALFTPKA